jgi:taurine dioxygenase
MSGLQIRRLGYALGAQITGIDLTGRLQDSTLAEIRQAWLDHIVLCFPGQKLGAEQMMDFCGRFGNLDDHRNSPSNRHPEYSSVKVFSNKRVVVGDTSYGGTKTGFAWHSDLSYTNHPSTGTFLLAKQLPDVGGETMWTNMYLAYEALSPAMRTLLDSLEAVHDHTMTPTYFDKSPEDQAADRKLNPPFVHPAILVHPETGRKALFVNSRVRRFVGMTDAESAPLLTFLNRHAERYEFIYRHRWTVDDLVMWDNRCTMHIAVQDYDRNQLRQMLRCTLLGPKTGRLYREDDALVAAAL